MSEPVAAVTDAPHETTLSGHLIEHLGRVPHPSETIDLDVGCCEVIRTTVAE